MQHIPPPTKIIAVENHTQDGAAKHRSKQTANGQFQYPVDNLTSGSKDQFNCGEYYKSSTGKLDSPQSKLKNNYHGKGEQMLKERPIRLMYHHNGMILEKCTQIKIS